MKKNNGSETGTNKFISYFIISIYFFLAVFVIVSMSSPDWLKKLSKTGKESEATIFKEYGDHFLDTGEFDKALAQYDHAVSINPDFPEAYTNMGICYYVKRDHKNALFYFKKSIGFKNKLHDVSYYYIGEVLTAKGESKKAIDFYLESAKLAPFPITSYQKAGDILTHEKQWEEAMATYDKAIENKFSMQNCYKGMLKENYHSYYDEDEIKQEIKNQLDKGMDSVDLSCYDAKVFNKQPDKYFDLASIYTQYGYVKSQIGQLDTAIIYFQKALQVDPNFENARINLNYANGLLKKNAQD